MIDELVSVVISVGERHDSIRELMEDYDRAIRKCISDYEYILVIDGEHPDVIEALNEFAVDRQNVRIVQLARSFGDAVAFSIGFDTARGQLIMTLPSYYQVEPKAIPKLVSALDEVDMIEGRRWPRQDSKLNRFSTWLYHAFLRVVTGHKFRDIGCCARIMRRQVADDVKIYGEQSTFLPILASTRGFTVRERSIPQSTRDPHLRYYGPGVYLRRLIDIITIFFLIRFTKAPLRFFGVVGSVFLAIGVVLLNVVVFQRFAMDIAAAGRPMLLFGVVFVVLGVQLFAIGLVGELIIFTHGRGMKEYSIGEIVSLEKVDDADSPSNNDPGFDVSRRRADAD
jgi:glycosyltransferase involved in cell wall biosynthesis